MDEEGQLINDLNGEDELGCVLRGHIHIENKIDYFIGLHVVKDKYLKDVQLDYSQKVSLALALGLPEWMSTPLKYIGNLRNNFAHNLGKSLGKQEIENFYKSFPGEEKDYIQKLIAKVNKRTPGKKRTLKGMPLQEQFSIFVISLDTVLYLVNEKTGQDLTCSYTAR